MKISILIIILSGFITTLSFAQNSIAKDTSANEGNVKTFSEQMPEFPGGEQGLVTYLTQTVHYPDSAKKTNIEGIVYVQFTVTHTGRITNIKIIRSPSGILSREAIRVIRNMPKWKPGRQDGVAVSVYYTLPINFTLTEN